MFTQSFVWSCLDLVSKLIFFFFPNYSLCLHIFETMLLKMALIITYSSLRRFLPETEPMSANPNIQELYKKKLFSKYNIWTIS